MSRPRSDAPDAPDDVQPELLDLLRDVTEYADMIGEATLADTSLSLASSGLLIAISRQPGITIAQLSRSIPKTPQTIGQVVARLHKLKLIDRRLGEGRGIGLHATDAGNELARLALTREAEIELRLRGILDPERYAQLIALLAEARSALRDAAGG